MDSFGKADIYLVSIRVPRDYEGRINKLIYEAAEKRSNVHLVDWYKASAGHRNTLHMTAYIWNMQVVKR